MNHRPIAMTIAGSDSSGGAGIQADLRMFSARGVYGTTVLTALTAQNPNAVTAVVGLEPQFVRAQIETVLAEFPIAAVKTGMLWSADIIETVSECVDKYTLTTIVDPVMIATSGAKLISDDAISKYKTHLFPNAALLTPNLDEACALLGWETIDSSTQQTAAMALFDAFGTPVLLKGGHLEGAPVDLLYDGDRTHQWTHERVHHVNTHGTGCMLAAAIAAELAKGGSLHQACSHAFAAVHHALQTASPLTDAHRLANIEATTSINK